MLFEQVKGLILFLCACGFICIIIIFSFDADPVIASIVVLVRIKGLQMMPMHENVELSFIFFFSGSQSPKLVDGDGTSKFLLPLLALSSSSSEDDLFNSRNQCFSYYFVMIKGSGFGLLPMTNGSGSGRLIYFCFRWIPIRIRIRNTELQLLEMK
jgi:hypothetical protein